MSSADSRWAGHRCAGLWRGARRLLAVAAISALTAGCFQPLYGERTIAGESSLREKLSTVEVTPINPQQGTAAARIGLEVRNALLYNLNGDGGASAPNYVLDVQLNPQRTSVIVDVTTARPETENLGIDATYTLRDISTGKTVLQGSTFSRVSFDIPGQQQRFARARGMRDAEDRAAKVIADNISQRLASYFVSGS